MLFKEIYQFHIKRSMIYFFSPQSQVYQRNVHRQGTTNLMKPTDIGDMTMVMFIAILITLPTTSGTVSRERLGQWWQPIAFHSQLATPRWLAGSMVIIPTPPTRRWRDLRVCTGVQVVVMCHIRLTYATAAGSTFINYRNQLAVVNVTVVSKVNFVIRYPTLLYCGTLLHYASFLAISFCNAFIMVISILYWVVEADFLFIYRHCRHHK